MGQLLEVVLSLVGGDEEHAAVERTNLFEQKA